MVQLIAVAMDSQQTEIPGVGVGDPVSLSFYGQRRTADTRAPWPDNYLRVGVISVSGYGGLVWYVSPERAKESGGS